jgi:hypothetical protein
MHSSTPASPTSVTAVLMLEDVDWTRKATACGNTQRDEQCRGRQKPGRHMISLPSNMHCRLFAQIVRLKSS